MPWHDNQRLRLRQCKDRRGATAQGLYFVSRRRLIFSGQGGLALCQMLRLRASGGLLAKYCKMPRSMASVSCFW